MTTEMPSHLVVLIVAGLAFAGGLIGWCVYDLWIRNRRKK